MIIAPSILAADFRRLEEQVRAAAEAGADWIHLDIMDGLFVPNISFGPMVVETLKPISREYRVPLDVHLMIEQPERYIERFAEAGAAHITVHYEACRHLHRTLQQIREAGCDPGVALNPATPVAMIEDVLEDLEIILIMTVNPGFGGQAYIPRSTERIRRTRAMLREARSNARIAVDGGVSAENAGMLQEAGVDVLIAGSAVFGGDIAQNMEAFRRALTLSA